MGVKYPYFWFNIHMFSRLQTWKPNMKPQKWRFGKIIFPFKKYVQIEQKPLVLPAPSSGAKKKPCQFLTLPGISVNSPSLRVLANGTPLKLAFLGWDVWKLHFSTGELHHSHAFPSPRHDETLGDPASSRQLTTWSGEIPKRSPEPNATRWRVVTFFHLRKWPFFGWKTWGWFY